MNNHRMLLISYIIFCLISLNSFGEYTQRIDLKYRNTWQVAEMLSSVYSQHTSEKFSETLTIKGGEYIDFEKVRILFEGIQEDEQGEKNVICSFHVKKKIHDFYNKQSKQRLHFFDLQKLHQKEYTHFGSILIQVLEINEMDFKIQLKSNPTLNSKILNISIKGIENTNSMNVTAETDAYIDEIKQIISQYDKATSLIPVIHLKKYKYKINNEAELKEFQAADQIYYSYSKTENKLIQKHIKTFDTKKLLQQDKNTSSSIKIFSNYDYLCFMCNDAVETGFGDIGMMYLYFLNNVMEENVYLFQDYFNQKEHFKTVYKRYSKDYKANDPVAFFDKGNSQIIIFEIGWYEYK